MKYFSMFSGIGGFELGIEKAYDSIRQRIQQGLRQKGKKHATTEQQFLGEKQPTCIGFSEIDKYATQIYKQHFPKHKNFRDATRIIPEELPDFDLLCGGFPCQSFSIAGKRKGFEDTRGTLFFEICRIARIKRPSYLFLENVRGLLSHNNGYTFLVILESLAELGYSLQWQVLNSKDFGVPQNRERVFVIGHLAEASPPKIFPIQEGNQEIIQKRDELCISGTISTKNQSGQAQWDGSTTLISNAIDSSYYKGIDNHKQHTGVIMREQFDVSGKGYNSQQDRIYHSEGIMACLPNAHPDNKLNIFTNKTIRRLTPIECERLQGFPDGWTEKGEERIWKENVRVKDVKIRRLLKSDIALNITKDGKNIKLINYPNEKKRM